MLCCSIAVTDYQRFSKGTRAPVWPDLQTNALPDNKTPKRILFDFAIDKPKIGAQWYPYKNLAYFNIPYINELGITRYVIIIKYDLISKAGRIGLQVNYLTGELWYCIPDLCSVNINHLTEKDFIENTIELTRFINSLGYSNFSPIEEVILKIEKELLSYHRTNNHS